MSWKRSGTAVTESAKAFPAILSKSSVFSLKQKEFRAADAWYKLARDRPLIDVRSGLAVHVLGTTMIGTQRAADDTKRLIKEIEPTLVAFEGTPEYWDTRDPRIQQIIPNFITAFTPVVESSRSAFAAVVRHQVGTAVSSEDEKATEDEERNRKKRFNNSLDKALPELKKFVRDEYVQSCRATGWVPAWESYVAYETARIAKKKRHAIGMPDEHFLKHVKEYSEAWKKHVYQFPPERKFGPLAKELARITGLELGDVLCTLPKTQSKLQAFWTLVGWKKRDLSNDGVSVETTPSGLNLAAIYEHIDPKTANAVNSCIGNEVYGGPQIRGKMMIKEEYIAYSLWNLARGVHRKKVSKGKREKGSEEKLKEGGTWPAPISAAVSAIKGIFPSDPLPIHSYEEPIIPYTSNPHIPPSPNVSLSSKKIVMIVERQNVPGLMRFWKQLNQGVQVEDRWDREAIKQSTLPIEKNTSAEEPAPTDVDKKTDTITP